MCRERNETISADGGEENDGGNIPIATWYSIAFQQFFSKIYVNGILGIKILGCVARSDLNKRRSESNAKLGRTTCKKRKAHAGSVACASFFYIGASTSDMLNTALTRGTVYACDVRVCKNEREGIYNIHFAENRTNDRKRQALMTFCDSSIMIGRNDSCDGHG